MTMPTVLILRSPGTNCDQETAWAFECAGARVESWHINRLREQPRKLRDVEVLCIPGGFSYGDDISAGKILACQLENFLADAIREFRNRDRLILGICNGFQVLLKAGLLLPPDEDGPMATLTLNQSGRFVDCWVHLQVEAGRCPFLTGLEQLDLPVAHGEGNFRCRQEWIARGLRQSGQAVLRYAPTPGGSENRPYNPNGSQGDVAGICDATGRVLGMMPHPERYVWPTQHPRWTREGLRSPGDGLALFRNAVDYFAL